MSHSLTLNGETLPILIQKRARARRMVIRYQPLRHAVSLTLPRHVSVKRGLEFIEKRRGWIEQQIGERPREIPFIDGQSIPVLGKTCRISHIGGRGVVRAEGEHVLVPGDIEFLPRRLSDWLKAEVRAEITRLAHGKAGQIGQTIAKISLRDPTSLWGSCTKGGRLSFSWRLVFAPKDVLDYIVSHEVAHLAELNHGPHFWKLVAQLCPHHEASRRWLRRHGAELYAYQ